MDTIVDLLPVVLVVLGSLIAALAAISPLTKSDVDNRLLDVLRSVADFIGRLIGAAGPKAKP
jgi:hypothetical protein